MYWNLKHIATAFIFIFLLLPVLVAQKTANDKSSSISYVESWITTGDSVKLLQPQSRIPINVTKQGNHPVIEVDTSHSLQMIDGFGFSLTGGSAFLINKMAEKEKGLLLQELFGHEPSSLGISYLRISIGASDLDAVVFSYNDLPKGEQDEQLLQFTLSKDTVALIPLLQKIIKINPGLKIMASPWSPPTWMKDNAASKGGKLLRQFYDAYARYFVKYIQSMQQKGIAIDAITIQNEPEHGGNNPSMLMNAEEQTLFVREHLGPAFRKYSIPTKIIIWDHNCDNPGYPIAILKDTIARKYVTGSAFHLYKGEINALSVVHEAHPDKQIYFTEQWTGSKEKFNTTLVWHIQNVIIGSMRNWSRIALEWNLANDPAYEPHTPGGCTECKGAITLNGSSLKRNISYYIIGHASRFVPPGSVRVASNEIGSLANAAFKTIAGKYVMIVVNDSSQPVPFTIHCGGQWINTSLEGGAVATYSW